MVNNEKTGASYSFRAPEIKEHENIPYRLMFPWPDVQRPTCDGAIDNFVVEQRSGVTFIDTGNMSDGEVVLLKTSEYVMPGDRLYVEFKSGANPISIYLVDYETESEQEEGGEALIAVLEGIADQTVVYEFVASCNNNNAGTPWVLMNPIQAIPEEGD